MQYSCQTSRPAATKKACSSSSVGKPPFAKSTTWRSPFSLDNAIEVYPAEPQHQMVAAVIRPSLAGREQPWLRHDQRELFAVIDLPAVRGVLAVRLEEGHDIVEGIREAARVVQELPDGDALSEGGSVAVEVEPPLGDELQYQGRHEDLRHAPDAESVIDCERLVRSEVGDTCRCLDPPVGQNCQGDSALHAGREDGFQLLID